MPRASRDELAEILLRSNKITQAQLEHARTEQRRRGGEIGPYLVALGFISEETLVRALSARFRLPAVNIDPDRIDPATARRIPEQFCRQNNMVCIGENARAKVLDVAMEHPSEAVLAEARVLAGCTVRCNLATRSAIANAIRSLFGEADGAQMDLSPDSPWRNDPHAMRAKAPTGTNTATAQAVQPAPPPPTPYPSPRAAPAPQPSPPRAPAAGSPKGAPGQRQPKRAGHGESLFHITMDDIPPLGDTDKDQSQFADRIARLEQLAEQNGRILEWLVNALVDSGTLLKDEVDMMLGRF